MLQRLQGKLKKASKRILLPSFGTLITLLVVVPAAFSLNESFDLMFNIATGRDILLHGFPATDPFSITAASPWFPHEWGYSVLSALVVKTLGGMGPALLIAAVLSSELLLLWWTLGRASNFSAATCIFFVLAIWGQDFAWTTERAYHLGHLMFAMGLFLVYLHHREKSFAKWLFIPLVALWANLHGSWIIGPALLGSYSVGRMIDLRKINRSEVMGLFASFLAFCAASLSPESFHTCLYPLGFLGGLYKQEIAEWHPLVLSNGCAKAILVLVTLSVIAAIRSRGKNWALFFPALGLTLVTLLIERFSPFASMAMALYLAATWKTDITPSNPLNSSLEKIAHAFETWNRNSGGQIWVVMILVLMVAGAAGAPQKLVDRLDPSLFPIKALEELRKYPPGKVFNTFRLGGAISAIDGPQYKVFIDGRSDLFPRRIHEDYKKVSLVLPGWKKIFEDYDPDYLLWSTLSYGSALLKELKTSDDWIILVDEPMGVLWMKKRKKSKLPKL